MKTAMCNITQISRDATCGSTAQRPRDVLLSDMNLPHSKLFFPLGYGIEIITNDQTVIRAASESFGHGHNSRGGPTLQIRIGVIRTDSSVCPPEPKRREFEHLYSLVADADNQALLDLKTCTSFAWVTDAAVDNLLYFRHNFLEKIVYLLLGASVVIDIHAACVSRHGKGILLCGDSGAGKSTLAYACARTGWTYTSDDTSYLINDSKVPHVVGHSHRVRFRPSAKAIFPELECFMVTPRMEGKPSIEVPISELPVPSTSAEAEVNIIIYLRRLRSGSGQLVRLPNGTAADRACQGLYSSGEIRRKHEKILQRFSVIPTYELQYANLDDAIRLLEILTRDA